MLDELLIRVLKEEKVMNEGLPGNDAEEVNQPLCGGADVGANSVAADGRGWEYGEIDVGIGVGRVEEAAEADGVGGLPHLEYAVDAEEVVEEATVLVPALAGTRRAKHRHKAWQVLVNGFELAAQEGTG